MDLGESAFDAGGTDRDSSANIPAFSDQQLTINSCPADYDWDAKRREQIRIRQLLEAAFPTDYDGLCDDAEELASKFMDSFRSYGGLSQSEAEYLIPLTLRSLEGAVFKTDWRKGYKKAHLDACMPEAAATLCIHAIRLVAEAFSSGGMRAYRNRHEAFIKAMAEFSEEANGAVSANRSFYEHLGKRVSQVVLDHKLTSPRPLFSPFSSDYKEVEAAALEQLVYFVQVGASGPVKIGIARDPAARLANLQTAHHETLEMRAITVGGAEQEVAYHRLFAEHRLRGEWFNPHANILAEIDRLNTQVPS